MLDLCLLQPVIWKREQTHIKLLDILEKHKHFFFLHILSTAFLLKTMWSY